MNNDLKKKLLKVARETIAEHLKIEKAELWQTLTGETELGEHNGIFVTLKINGELRGCIGNIVTDRPILESVRKMAIQSAFSDPRFCPLTNEEFEKIEIEISILSKPKKVGGINEIVLGRDGIILESGFHGALFLPQVATEQNWNLETTLTHLSLKAGLGRDIWKTDKCTFSTFQAEYFNEADFGRYSNP